MSSLQKLKSLSACQQRKAAAILGALVADAAITPLHWIYDQEKVASLIQKEKGIPDFYPTSQCPFYNVPVGNNSTYGDQLYVTLKNIAENKGFDAGKLGDTLFEFFGPGTVYEKARLQSGSPIQGPWTNHCLKIMIANRENGVTPAGDKNSKDPDGLCKAVALVGLLTDVDNITDKVPDCVQTAQLNPMASDFAVAGMKILAEVVKTGKVDIQGDSTEPGKAIQMAIAKVGTSHTVAAKEFGLACSYPASFTVGIHGILSAKSFVDAVRDEARASGDTCSRVIFVAAVCGAQYGLDGIPEDWLKKYPRTEEVLGYIETVVQL